MVTPNPSGSSVRSSTESVTNPERRSAPEKPSAVSFAFHVIGAVPEHLAEDISRCRRLLRRCSADGTADAVHDGFHRFSIARRLAIACELVGVRDRGASAAAWIMVSAFMGFLVPGVLLSEPK